MKSRERLLQKSKKPPIQRLSRESRVMSVAKEGAQAPSARP